MNCPDCETISIPVTDMEPHDPPTFQCINPECNIMWLLIDGEVYYCEIYKVVFEPFIIKRRE